jgi:hypothetical protein
MSDSTTEKEKSFFSNQESKTFGLIDVPSTGLNRNQKEGLTQMIINGKMQMK